MSFAFGLSAEIEHKLISQHTKEALASRKAQGKHIGRGFGSDYKFQNAMKKENEIISLVNDGWSIGEICRCMSFSAHIFDKIRLNSTKIDTVIKVRGRSSSKFKKYY